MTTRTILVLLIFIVVCGLIAYFGDLLGRRMGKRRLTLFGMRPRYTAVFMTVLTGMVIAAVTIGIMAAVSENVRLLMVKGDNIISRMNELTDDYENAKESYQKAVDNLSKQRKITIAANNEAERAKSQSRSLTTEMIRVKENLSQLKMNLTKNIKLLKLAESGLVNTRNDLDKAKSEISDRKHEIDLQQSEIDRLDSLKNRLAERLDKDAMPRLKALRERQIIFRPGEEIVRKVIDCDQSKSLIRKDIDDLLAEADVIAGNKGATIGENGSYVHILPKSVEDENGKITFLEDKKTIDAIVDNISQATGTVVILLISVGNSLDGEQALVEFTPPFRNNLIYLKDDRIASSTIDGSKTRGSILGDLISFLRVKVRGEVIDKGIIPQFDSDGQPVVGQIDDWDEIFDLVDKIKNNNDDTVINAYAAADTWSSGPIMLKFSVGD